MALSCIEYELGYKYTKYYNILKESGITYDTLPDEYTIDTKYKFARLKIEEAQFRKGSNDNAWYVFDQKVPTNMSALVIATPGMA